MEPIQDKSLSDRRGASNAGPACLHVDWLVCFDVGGVRVSRHWAVAAGVRVAPASWPHRGATLPVPPHYLGKGMGGGVGPCARTKAWFDQKHGFKPQACWANHCKDLVGLKNPTKASDRRNGSAPLTSARPSYSR